MLSLRQVIALTAALVVVASLALPGAASAERPPAMHLSFRPR